MKRWTGGMCAVALMVSAGANAQDAKGLLRQIGQAISGTPKAVSERARSPYMDPAGTYWDLDGETLAGAQHLRAGLASTGAGGRLTCDAYLIAITRSDYRLTPSQRQQCLYIEWVIDTKVNGANGITQHQVDAIERKYGPAFDARAERFRHIDRFAVRAAVDPSPSYNHERAVLDIYVPIPWVMGFSVNGYTGEGFVPDSVRIGNSVGSTATSGRYHLPIRMSEAGAHALFKQGRDGRDDLVVFTVKRVWLENGSPRAEIDVERVEVGYRDEKIGVDLIRHKEKRA